MFEDVVATRRYVSTRRIFMFTTMTWLRKQSCCGYGNWRQLSRASFDQQDLLLQLAAIVVNIFQVRQSYSGATQLRTLWMRCSYSGATHHTFEVQQSSSGATNREHSRRARAILGQHNKENIRGTPWSCSAANTLQRTLRSAPDQYTLGYTTNQSTASTHLVSSLNILSYHTMFYENAEIV